jgi:hypothetical protein
MSYRDYIKKNYFSTNTKDYFTPADVKGDKLTLKDIHTNMEVVVKVKNPETTKAERKEAKNNLLLSLAKSKFPNLKFETEKDVHFHAKSSNEVRLFITDFSILFSTAQRMPHKYFAKNISFETWIKVLEGREKLAELNEKHSKEIAAFTQQRKTLLETQREESQQLLDNTSIVVQIDNLKLDHVPSELLEGARLVADAEAQAKKLREILMDFKAAELARFTKSPSDYKLPDTK